MKFKIIIVVSIFLLSVNHSKIMAQIPGEYFNSCLTSAPLSCGNNTISLPILPGYPAIATNSGDHIVRYYLNVTTPITTSIFFTGVNMQPYSIIISTPLSGS